MNLKTLWTTTALLAVSGAWIGCEPMSSPMPSPSRPMLDSKPKAPAVDAPSSAKESEADKPAESSDKADSATKEEDKKPEAEKPKDSEKPEA